MLVDSDADRVHLTRQWIEWEGGPDAEVAAGGDEALDILGATAQRFDLVAVWPPLADCGDVDFFGVLRRCRSPVRLVAVTALTPAEARSGGPARGSGRCRRQREAAWPAGCVGDDRRRSRHGRGDRRSPTRTDNAFGPMGPRHLRDGAGRALPRRARLKLLPKPCNPRSYDYPEESHEQDHPQEGPDGPGSDDRTDRRIGQGVRLAGGTRRCPRAVPRDRADRSRRASRRSASTTAPVPTPTPTSRSMSRRACRAIARRWIRERGGVEQYDGREIKPEDNGNVTGKHLARDFPNKAQPFRGCRRRAGDAVRVRPGRHHHQGDDLRRAPREPRPQGRRWPAPRRR